MRRSDALTRLSRDHHHGLAVAQRLRRATGETAAPARSAFLSFWEREGREHFRAEEDVLLPAFARHGAADDPDVVRVLVEHVEIRRRAADLTADASPPLPRMHELGALLHDHIRHEERVLFPRIERLLPEPELLALGAALERAHDGTD